MPLKYLFASGSLVIGAVVYRTSAVAPRAEGWFYQRLRAGKVQTKAEGFVEQVPHLCGARGIAPGFIGHVQPPLLRGEGLCQ